jgi:hypothetical protein
MPHCPANRQTFESAAMNRNCLSMPKSRKAHEVRRGHAPHLAGAGVHADRRTRRRRSRQAAGGGAVRDSEENV